MRVDDGAAHLHAVGAGALGALVLRGLVERAQLGELLLLVDAAAAKLAVGGRLVVCSLTRAAWGQGETAAEADLVAGHPLRPRRGARSCRSKDSPTSRCNRSATAPTW